MDDEVEARLIDRIVSDEWDPGLSDAARELGESLRSAFPADAARSWLRGRNAHLGGARPVDVVRLEGAQPVLDALGAELAGGYA